MKGHGEKLSRNREKAIKALLEHDTISAAAKAAGVSEATLWRWLKQTDFSRAYKEAKKQILDHALGRLQNATNGAIKALISIVADEKAPASARVSGARAILETSIKVADIESLESRVEALEQAFAK